MADQRNPRLTFREEFAISKIRLAQPNASWHSTSPFMSDGALLAVRLVFALFAVGVIITSGVMEGGPKWFVFLTNWQFLMVTLSFIGFSGLSIQRILLRRANASAESGEWRWFHNLQQLVFSVALPVSLMVTVLYWGLLDAKIGFVSVSVHAVNVVLTFTEVCISNFKVNVLHSLYTITFSTIYLVFSVVYTTAGGTNSEGMPFIYSPLDWSNKPGSAAALAVPVALVAAPGAHLLAYGLCKLRMALETWLAEKRGETNTISNTNRQPSVHCAEDVV